ncbi:MAG: hypothetical protein O3A55_01965 [Bacteroidetes bacterium]|nr:hypothetical protein [Bacteroidota bacterium]
MREFLNLPLDASAHGLQIDEMISLIHWVMFILTFGWGLFFAYTLYKFRSSKNTIASYTGVTSKTSTWLEVGMVVFEAILLIGFAIPLWADRVVGFPKKDESLIVRVVAEQFAWNIHYPGKDGEFGKTDITLVTPDNPLGIDRNDESAKDDIITNNQLNIPINKPIIVYLSSKDVIHGFALPVLRVKHDAIPGTIIPVWFKATKTTKEIQEQTVQTFDLTNMPIEKNINLPEVVDLKISQGKNYKNYILMENVSKDGVDLLYSGMILDNDNVTALISNNVSTVKARKIDNTLQTLLTIVDYKDVSGNIILPKGSSLIDDMVSMLLQNNITKVQARHKARLDQFIFWEDYNLSDGVIISKGTTVTDLNLEQLKSSNINLISIALATPTEIACAQLCGLGHYRMRGYVNIQTEDEYNLWMAEREAELNPVE